VSGFFVLLDGDTPLGLLRRVRQPDGGYAEQALRRDLSWSPTDRFRINDWNGEYAIEEVTADQAARIVDGWRSAWAARET
jgi:hypothetical protein